MSVLAKTLSRVPVRRALAAAPRASFTTTTLLHKTVVDSAKDTLKTVDRKVSDKLVDGINVAESVGSKVTQAAGEKMQRQTHQPAADELRAATAKKAGEAKGKMSEMAGEAKGKMDEVAGEAKGKAHEVAGKAEGKAKSL